MTYAVQADMQSEFGDVELAQLTDRNNGAVIDPTVLTPALQRADDEINSYIAQLYTLPLTTVPARLKACAMDIARYYLFDARAPQIVVDRYKQSIAWLKDVSANKATLGTDVAGNLAAPANTGADYAVVASDQVFTDDLFCQV